ncbi:MAG: hypothetical protein AB7V39_16725 [Nitrospiraceae bacterium]
MSAIDWTVIAGGLAAIVWINWYFFLAQRRAVAADSRRERNGHGETPNAKSNEYLP